MSARRGACRPFLAQGPTPTLLGTRFTGLIKGQGRRVRGRGPDQGTCAPQLPRQTSQARTSRPRGRPGKGIPVPLPPDCHVHLSPHTGTHADHRVGTQTCSVRSQNRALTGRRRPRRGWAHLLRPQLPLASCVRRGVTLLLQVDLHELVHGQLTGGGVFEFREPKTEMGQAPCCPAQH